MTQSPRASVHRAIVVTLYDVLAIAGAWIAAYWLRFNLDIPPDHAGMMLKCLAFVVPVQATVFLAFGLHRGIWLYSGLADLKRVLLAVTVSAMATALFVVMARGWVYVPRSVILLDPIILVALVGGGRVGFRLWKEFRVARSARGTTIPVLVVGAGRAASALLRELATSRQWNVVGLVDDARKTHGRHLSGVRILGGIDDLGSLVRELDVHHVIIAIPSASHAVRRRVVNCLDPKAVKVLTVPAFDDLLSGKVTVSQVRAVEVDDLLGRDPVVLDDAGLHGLMSGRVVMVTGAGGSIGSELARQIAKFAPRLVVMVENSEFALYRLEQEFRERFPALDVEYHVADVKNRVRMTQILSCYRPSILLHAAAYKHVPMMENGNAWEAVQNNALGTHTLAELAIEHGVDRFVLISTDKAVNPVNVMGATKRLAEMICLAMQGAGKTKFVAVRFGNVLGSTGSVIPKFREQLLSGGPITVTHPDITRYFMSISEAAQLVLQACLMGRGGEIFVLDMGEPVRIVDLARDMIRLAGLSEQDIPIAFTGLRPGEKLYEELLSDEEDTAPTDHPKLRVVKTTRRDRAWLDGALAWMSQPHALAEYDVKKGLQEWIPEYRSSL